MRLDAARDRLIESDPAIPETLHDRAADNWRPLLAIADQCGEEWSAKGRAAALALSNVGQAEDASIKVQLLEDIQSLFADKNTDKLPSRQIVFELGNMEERPWGEWYRGQPMTTRQLAKQLKQFDIRPINIRTAGGIAKGYTLESFADAFVRYIR